MKHWRAEALKFQQHRDDDWPHHKGDTLEILEGPFAGRKAIYQISGAKERALLLITRLGRETQVELPMDACLKANNASGGVNNVAGFRRF